VVWLPDCEIFLKISMIDSTKVLCPLLDKVEILIPGDGLSIFPVSGQNVKF